jgi:hypothetical protein
MLPRIVNEDKEFTVAVGDKINIVLKTRYASIISQTAYYLPDGTRKSGLPAGLEKKIDYTERTLTLSGAPTEAGDYKLLISLTGLNSEKVTDTLTIHATTSPDGIVPYVATELQQTTRPPVYDILGRRYTNTGKGLFLVRRGDKYIKVVK